MFYHPDRVERDVIELCDTYDIRHLPAVDAVVIENYTYPRGWRPRTAPLFIHIPKMYPNIQPAAYIPTALEYQGPHQPVDHRYNGELTYDGWIQWCTHYFDRWDPDQHDLRDFIELIELSLAKPNSENPVRESD